MKKVAFHTLGCKLNFSESSALAKEFVANGYETVVMDMKPDVLVVNTCTVTDNANRKCRKVINKALKSVKKPFIIVTGCYAQLKPKEIAGIKGVDLVLGSAEKFDIIKHLEKSTPQFQEKIFVGELKDNYHFNPAWSGSDRTRSFLKIQDGCDYFCSFCTIPMARGRSRSDTIQGVLNNISKILKNDVREIVLTGVNIGDFGKMNGDSFLELIQQIEKVEGLERVRISSIEPNLLTNEIIEHVANSSKFMPHFHIPLQSGSDKILKLMRRKYNRSLYKQRINNILQLIPDCCIGVDVIAGFPGETEDDFLDTFNFLNDLDIAYIHAFTYSERENTTALRIEDIVPISTRRKRSKMLQLLSEKKRRSFYNRFIGNSRNVLFEGKLENGFIFGYTDNYIKVKAEEDPELVNSIEFVELKKTEREEVLCEVQKKILQPATLS